MDAWVPAAVSSAVLGAFGWWRGRAAGAAAADAGALALADERRRSQRRHDEQERRAEQGLAAWQAAALGATLQSVSLPVYPARAAPAELEWLAERLRGLALLDAVVVTDAVGLSLSRHESPASRGLAAAASALLPLGASLGGFSSASFCTTDGLHGVVRTLPAWAGGACLAAARVGRPPSPLALDAAVAQALLARRASAGFAAAGPLVASAGSRGVVVGDPALGPAHGLLKDWMGRQGLRGAVLLQSAPGQPVRVCTGLADDGPPASDWAAVALVLDQAAATVSRRLRARGLQQLDLHMGTGAGLGLARLDASAQLLTFFRGSAPEPVVFERLAAVLRRQGVLPLLGAAPAGSKP
jgi:hypothetical protein